MREAVQRGDVEVLHIRGAINLAGMFTKEDKDTQKFILIRDTIMDTPNIEIRESEQSVVDLMPSTSPQAQGGDIGSELYGDPPSPPHLIILLNRHQLTVKSR